MSACGNLPDPNIELFNRPGTPQATQSAPASIKQSFDLSQYLEADHYFIPRRFSEGRHRQALDASTYNLSLPRTSSHFKAILKTTEVSFPTTVVSEYQFVSLLPGSMAASVLESNRERVPSRYNSPPGTSTEAPFNSSPGNSLIHTEKRNMRFSSEPNRELATQEELPVTILPRHNINKSLATSAEVRSSTIAGNEPTKGERRSDTSVSNMQELLPIPETSLEISRLQFGGQGSFNTSVRDLIQECPDTPIGTKVLIRKDHLSTSMKGPLGSLTNFSEQLPILKRFQRGSGSRARFTASNCEASVSMITASAHPTKRRADIATDLSYDGPAGDLQKLGTDVRDFAFNPATSSPLHEQSISPHTTTSSEGLPAVNVHSNISALDGIFSERRVQEENSQSTSMEKSKEKKSTNNSARSHPDSVNPNGPVEDLELRKKEHHSAKKVPERVSKQLLGGVLPVDTTALASTPTTPLSGTNDKGPLHRRIRGRVLVTPVLSIVIGRQLARPTRNVLKQAAKTAKVATGPVAAEPIPM